jgi:hypothetical protein
MGIAAAVAALLALGAFALHRRLRPPRRRSPA